MDNLNGEAKEYSIKINAIKTKMIFQDKRKLFTRKMNRN